jgi:hypothetical protein
LTIAGSSTRTIGPANTPTDIWGGYARISQAEAYAGFNGLLISDRNAGPISELCGPIAGPDLAAEMQSAVDEIIRTAKLRSIN